MKSIKTEKVFVPPEMIHLWETLEDPCGVKDLQSRFVYVNPAYYSMNGLPKTYDIIGALNDEVPAPVAAAADQLRAHDRLAIESCQRKSSLEIHKFGFKREYQAYIVDKMPFFDAAGNVVGSWFHARQARTLSLDILADNNKSGTVILYNPSSDFTDAEWLVIFLLLRRFSQKEIAKLLNLSVSRVNSRVSEIYIKAGIFSSNQLRDFIFDRGWQNFIPEHFSLRGHLLIK